MLNILLANPENIKCTICQLINHLLFHVNCSSAIRKQHLLENITTTFQHLNNLLQNTLRSARDFKDEAAQSLMRALTYFWSVPTTQDDTPVMFLYSLFPNDLQSLLRSTFYHDERCPSLDSDKTGTTSDNTSLTPLEVSSDLRRPLNHLAAVLKSIAFSVSPSPASSFLANSSPSSSFPSSLSSTPSHSPNPTPDILISPRVMSPFDTSESPPTSSPDLRFKESPQSSPLHTVLPSQSLLHPLSSTEFNISFLGCLPIHLPEAVTRYKNTLSSTDSIPHTCVIGPHMCFVCFTCNSLSFIPFSLQGSYSMYTPFLSSSSSFTIILSFPSTLTLLDPSKTFYSHPITQLLSDSSTLHSGVLQTACHSINDVCTLSHTHTHSLTLLHLLPSFSSASSFPFSSFQPSL